MPRRLRPAALLALAIATATALTLTACSGGTDDRVNADKKRSVQPVFDDQAQREMGNELKKLVDDRKYAEERELIDEYTELDQKIGALQAQINAGMTKT